MLFFQYLNSTEKWQGVKFSVQYSFSFGLAFICSGNSSLISTFQQHSDSSQSQCFLKKKVLSYEIRSISSVLLIKSYFNIKYSYSILYTSFSLLAEYCYWLFKQKNFNHFALQRFGGTIQFPAATLITVVGERTEGKTGVYVPKLYIRLRSRLKEGSFSECKDWSHSVEHETLHSLVFPLESSPSYSTSHPCALLLPSTKPFSPLETKLKSLLPSVVLCSLG